MTELDDLTDRLRAQMASYTADDTAPTDLPVRVRRAAVRRRRAIAGAAAGSCAVLAGGALVLGQQSTTAARPDSLAAPAAGPPALSLEQYDTSGGSVETQSPGGLERVQLPAAVRNDGSQPVTLLSMKVDGTGLAGTFDRRTVAPGGRQPLSLTGPVDCTSPALPDRPVLRVEVLAPSGPVTVTLPLPEAVVATYRLLGACSRSPEAAARDEAAATARGQAEVTALMNDALTRAGIDHPPTQASPFTDRASGRTVGWTVTWTDRTIRPKVVVSLNVYPEPYLPTDIELCPSTEPEPACSDEVLGNGVRLVSGQDNGLGFSDENPYAFRGPTATAFHPDGRQVTASVELVRETGDEMIPPDFVIRDLPRTITLDRLRTVVVDSALTGIAQVP